MAHSVSFTLLQRPEHLEFPARKLFLPVFSVELREMVMRGFPIWSKPDRFFEFVHRADRPVFVRVQQSELKMRVGEAWTERHGLVQQRLDLLFCAVQSGSQIAFPQ